MVSRRLLVVNVVLGIVSVALAAGIVRTFIVRRALPAPAAPRAAAAPPPAAASVSADPGLAGYTVIAARNLFNPGRSETATAAAPVSKPILHGVVINGAKSRAFLEEPPAKRVSGYSVGDPISGGRIQQITDDRVVIARPEGLLEVLLQDPSKPRATPVSAAPGQQAPPAAQPPTAGAAPPGAPTSPPTPPQPVRRAPPLARPGDG
jgi:Type II secretion system protein C